MLLIRKTILMNNCVIDWIKLYDCLISTVWNSCHDSMLEQKKRFLICLTSIFYLATYKSFCRRQHTKSMISLWDVYKYKISCKARTNILYKYYQISILLCSWNNKEKVDSMAFRKEKKKIPKEFSALKFDTFRWILCNGWKICIQNSLKSFCVLLISISMIYRNE